VSFTVRAGLAGGADGADQGTHRRVPWVVIGVRIVTVIPGAIPREAAMSMAEGLSSGAGGKSVRLAPGLWTCILEGSLEDQVEGQRRGRATAVRP